MMNQIWQIKNIRIIEIDDRELRERGMESESQRVGEKQRIKDVS